VRHNWVRFYRETRKKYLLSLRVQFRKRYNKTQEEKKHYQIHGFFGLFDMKSDINHSTKPHGLGLRPGKTCLWQVLLSVKCHMGKNFTRALVEKSESHEENISIAHRSLTFLISQQDFFWEGGWKNTYPNLLSGVLHLPCFLQCTMRFDLSWFVCSREGKQVCELAA
jgi:hypothetical protein